MEWWTENHNGDILSMKSFKPEKMLQYFQISKECHEYYRPYPKGPERKSACLKALSEIQLQHGKVES